MNKESRILNFSAATFILVWCAVLPFCYIFYSNFIRETPPVTAIPKKQAEVVSPQSTTADFSNALAAAEKGIEINPGYQTYLNLGLVYYQSGKYQESIEATKKALEYNAKSAVAYNNLAAAYGMLAQWDLEIEACKKALEIEPDMQLAKNNLAWAISEKQKVNAK